VPILLLLVLIAGAGGAGYVLLAREAAGDRRQDAVDRFVAAWERGDHPAMWRTLSAERRRDWPLAEFAASYRIAARQATIESVEARPGGEPVGGRAPVRVRVRTRGFGELRGTITLRVVDRDGEAFLDWSPAWRLPGLRDGENVRRRVLERPARRPILAADGSRLDATPLGASIAGRSGDRPTGLQRIYDDRLGGHPSARLMFGDRIVARTRAKRGRRVRTTIQPALMRAASAALGDRLGGVAVIRPRDGSVRALAGLAVSAPQPPGSVFKIITAAAALDERIVRPSTNYPVQTAATLEGVSLRNAGGEACGGTLFNSFVHSCNSVFAPLGAKLGARRLVAAARAFGFGEQPAIPAAKPSTISRELRDDLAVGAAAIGQDRDLATPLTMASVGATIANRGRRARPRITTRQKVERRRVVSSRAARQVRDMMVGVVQSGTGTAAALSGVQVAGKTGTAELVPNSSDPKDANAWFVAFAPADRPRVAVAVMLVGAGFGGTAAAPVAREVLEAAL
jgi:beta-lactamase class D